MRREAGDRRQCVGIVVDEKIVVQTVDVVGDVLLADERVEAVEVLVPADLQDDLLAAHGAWARAVGQGAAQAPDERRDKDRGQRDERQTTPRRRSRPRPDCE